MIFAGVCFWVCLMRLHPVCEGLRGLNMCRQQKQAKRISPDVMVHLLRDISTHEGNCTSQLVKDRSGYDFNGGSLKSSWPVDVEIHLLPSNPPGADDGMLLATLSGGHDAGAVLSSDVKCSPFVS